MTTAAQQVQPPPEFAPITVHIVVPNMDEAVKFLQEVFHAKELQRNKDDTGKVWHCEVLLNGVRLLLMEEFPDMELRGPKPQETGGNSVMLNVFTPDVDGTFDRAMKAGSKAMIKPHDAFWGDRYAEFRDPLGHRFALSYRKERLAPEEQDKRAHQFRAQHGQLRSPAPALKAK